MISPKFGRRLIGRISTRTLWLLALLPAAGYSQFHIVNRPSPPPDAVARGRAAFVSTCGFCHGTNAKGGSGGPDLVRSPIVLDDEQGDKIGPVILNGRPDRGMPAFSMTKDQIADIAAFLRDRTQSAVNRMEYAIQDIVTGDAKAGQAYFNGAGKCNSCHAPTGDLAGVGAKYDPVALQTHFLYPHPSDSKVKLTRVTVTKAGAPPVSGILEVMDDFVVGLRDGEGYYHSFSRDDVKLEIHDPLAAHADLLSRYTDADMHNLLAYLVTLK
jgi:mono/diheme cytochrome c family protein